MPGSRLFITQFTHLITEMLIALVSGRRNREEGGECVGLLDVAGFFRFNLRRDLVRGDGYFRCNTTEETVGVVPCVDGILFQLLCSSSSSSGQFWGRRLLGSTDFCALKHVVCALT